ncbi:DUF3859 domain-containing protein [Marinilabilia rubra]|uniref:DUF3859 domain-containing protein n=1 Tax=Marinilabilia rubra TaxID=2162893 RepID=A0A2U2BE53_9BACT|nr:DUF3859 domain-containing protein [Marinilabilia rubra]PWE01354.1 DUF3859 domain-containing protein [Marinilabilia rubra]
MPKRKRPQVELYSYGIYSAWDRTSKDLPKLQEITTEIPVTPEVEFGYVLKIKGGKGEVLDFEIVHPPFPDSNGNPAPPFTGQVVINSNDWEFFLGDTVWEPYENKAGDWILVTRLQGKEVARKTLRLYLA